jgi:hypothetical protein
MRSLGKIALTGDVNQAIKLDDTRLIIHANFSSVYNATLTRISKG